MSMLAEPRRKQIIGPNPRGKFLKDDKDNAGRKLLNKMGWKDGDGLGKEGQGNAEPIRPKIQMTSKGLGFDVKNDPWVQHSEDFSAVLKQLNEEHGTGGSSQQDEDQQPLQSETEQLKLESKSKSSKARIHYHKLVKGKDLSQASTEDLKSIFGNTTGLVETNTTVKAEPKSDEDEDVAQSSARSKRKARRSSGLKENTEEVVFDPTKVDNIKKEPESVPGSPDSNPFSGMSKSTSTDKKKKKARRNLSKRINDSSVPQPEAEPDLETIDEAPEPEPEYFGQINRGSMMDYFAKKMAERLERVNKPEDEVQPGTTQGTAEKKAKKRKGADTDSSKAGKKKSKGKGKKTELEQNNKDSAIDEIIPDPEPPKEVISKRVTRRSSGSGQGTAFDLAPPAQEVISKRVTRRSSGSGQGTAADDLAPPAQEETLEDRLKREMIELKTKKCSPKNLSAEEMMKICKRFPGANLHKIKGYAYY